jgi:hypothetical protein
VLAIISARKIDKDIQDYLKMFYLLFQTDLEAQKAIARYHNPAPFPLKSSYRDLHYIHGTRFVVRGQLSDVMSIWREGETSWLRWKGVSYQKVSEDPVTHALSFSEESWSIMEAPKANLDMDILFG